MKTIWTIMRKELSRVFKDPKLIITVIILPGALLFIMYTFMGNMFTEKEVEPSTYNILYDETISVDLVNTIENFKEMEYFEITTKQDNLSLEEVKELLINETYDVYFYESNENSVLELKILYNDEKVKSELITMIINEYLTQNIVVGSQEYLYLKPQSVIKKDIVEQARSAIATIIPFLIMTFLFQGAMSVGPESIAGDKERGTISTLLTTPTKRSHIAIGKIFSLSILAVLSALSSFVGVILSMGSLTQVEGVVNYSALEYFSVLIVIVTSVLLITSLISVLSATAKNIKEASMLSMPLMIISMILGILTMGSSEGTQSTILYLIPLYNSSQVLVSIFNQQSFTLALTITAIANIIYASIFAIILTRQFNNEKMMFSK